MTEEGRGPRRLIDGGGPSGELLRAALSERPSEPVPRFTQLQERRLARASLHTGLAFAAAALAVLVGMRALKTTESPLTVRAEPVAWRSVVATSTASPSVSASSEMPPALPPLTMASPAKKNRLATGRAREELTVAAPALGEELPLPATPAPPPSGGGAKACAEQARHGAIEQGIACYERLANGDGVTAELALFEQARLAGKALRQPARALSLLDTYRQRFPNGSLRAEAMLAGIEWALAAGDSGRARRDVDEALASGLLRERRAELERLRDSLNDASAH